MAIQFYLRSICALLLAFSAFSAQSAQDCRDISDAQARLACFDALYPKQDEKADDVMSDNILGPMIDEEPEQMQETVVDNDDRMEVEEQRSTTKSRQKPKKEKKRGWFSVGDKQHYEGSIIEMLNKPQQRMVFRLDNDELWIQTTPRNLPIKVGDKVTIKRGTVGGYILRTDDNVSTRVSQIPDE